MILDVTVPDQPVVDIVRGAVAVVGAVLFVVAPVVWWRARRVLPSRIAGLVGVLIGADVYVAATEAQQIGHRMLWWRLPVGFAVVVGALLYVVRLAVAVGDDRPIR